MADSTVADVNRATPFSADGFGSAPPVDSSMLLEEQLMTEDWDLGDDVGVLDFDFFFEDFYDSSADFDGILSDPAGVEKPGSFGILPGPDPNFNCFASDTNFDPYLGVFKSGSAELRHVSGENKFTGVDSSDGSGVLNSVSPALESHQISVYLNVTSPKSDGSNEGASENCDGDAKKLNYNSPETQGSGNFESNVSENSNDCAAGSVSSSPNAKGNSVRNGCVDREIKLEQSRNHSANSSLFKRKKEWDDLANEFNVESMITKCGTPKSDAGNDDSRGFSEEEEKRKTRLLRNRESAQLSRQRKKHYVEELEDKVKVMHSTIQGLNAKISYFMSENETLRQQMGSGGTATTVPLPQMARPSPGMYPHPAMMYPWIPGAPPYVMNPQVPLVPIPRLKPQQPAQAPRTSRKVDIKKNERVKTKKTAGVSFLGLLFFIVLLGGLVPMINVRYGGVREVLTGGESYIGYGSYEKHRGRVLMVNDTEFGENCDGGRGCSGNSSLHFTQIGSGGSEPNADEFAHVGNRSEPLIASLYVPRNDKLVKIDGNLIIHSVLASEKAVASNQNGDGDTGLVVPLDLTPAIPVPGVGRNGIRQHPHLRAIGSGSRDTENLKSAATDGRLQQWFREGLAGPMLSSGMCTEVFLFDVSSASSLGAIFPASTSKNISEARSQNSTHLGKGRNRRLLHDQPVPPHASTHNTSKEHKQRNPQNDNINGSSLASSMVVSVLVDPREAGDSDVDGVLKNSASRIFVVVLIDNVKYVTYSCMLPYMGSAPHLVTN